MRHAGGMVVLAVDDEEPALDELAHLLAAHPAVGTVLRAQDATEALRIVHGDGGVDAVFLDVRMPGLDGMELARICGRSAAPPAVVFVTAHETRAVEAYEVGAVDYLLKPLRGERLGRSLERVRGHRVPAPKARADDVIAVPLAGTTTLVSRGAVRYAVAHGDYVRLHTDSGSHLVRIPLAVLEERWSDAGFLRVHRSYLVAVPLVTALRGSGKGHVVQVGSGSGAVRLPVSRRHLSSVRRLLRGMGGPARATA